MSPQVAGLSQGVKWQLADPTDEVLVGRVQPARQFRVRAALAEGPKRAVDLFGALFTREIGSDLLSFATREALATLNHLQLRGQVVADQDVSGVNWYRLDVRQLLAG
ncbi:hypothetical protein [Pseudomonas cavernicola]|uniref:hypothetical protein n=1 Tax=Pseudomonas cavernicola TaxID=2320866 RepID=UPI0011C41316|nr:hypothetical protein [Pseudomonas cavernicola]